VKYAVGNAFARWLLALIVLCLADGHVLGLLWSESIAELREGVIPDGLQDLSYGLLD